MIATASTHLGQYRLDAQLGSGGMGIVYQAIDETLDREVAIKVLHPHLLQKEDLKERFRREARMHAQLMHPNVVTLLSLYEDQEHMALVMEMVHGKNLKEYLGASKKHSMAHLLSIAQSILTGLEAAHQLGLVHRDLKPANVLISNTGEVKLMDFGLAKSESGADDLTQSGATVGSFRYMAPEQILNQPVDARTDLYAIGILLYQLMTGKLPFDASAQGGGEFEIMEKQVREEAVAPHEVNTSLPLEISDLILRLLAKHPKDRPQNCAVVRQELDIIASHLSDQMISSGTYPKSLTMKHRNIDVAKGLIWAVIKPLGKLLPASFSVNMARFSKPQLSAGGLLLLFFLAGSIWLGNKAPVPEEVTNISSVVVSPPTVVDNKPEPLPKSEAAIVIAPAIVEALVPKKRPSKLAVTKPLKVKSIKVIKPKKVSRSITYSMKHKVRRSDGGKVDPNQPHEFKGGKHLYFAALKEYGGKGHFIAYKKGQVRLYLAKAVPIRKIILHKASVGSLSFKGGYVKLSVQDAHRKWHNIFERHDDDVDKAVVIRHAKLPKLILGIRIRMRSPEPMLVGPIDLLR